MFKRIMAWLKALLASKPAPAVTPAPQPIPVPDPQETPAVGDRLDLSTVAWVGAPVVNALVTARITAASTNGGTLTTEYDPYDWPAKTVKVEVDAIAYFFYRQAGGSVVGGKFDWWRAGGQRLKGLENVHSGYQGHVMPSKGTECWTMISSVDGKQRSNTICVEWR